MNLLQKPDRCTIDLDLEHAPICQRNSGHYIPLAANSCQSRVVILHSNKRATGIRLDIRLTTEVLHYSLARAVSDRGHVEYTSLVFTAVESQLSERQMCSEFFHGPPPQKRLVIVIVADSSV